MRILALCGIAGPIIFAILVTVAGSLYDGYSHASQAISELGGVDAERPLLQNINFFLVGTMFMALAVGLHRVMGGGGRPALGPALVFIFGLSAGIGNGVFPCDSGCEGGWFNGFMHNLTGIIGFVAAISSIFVFSRRLKGDPDWGALYPVSRVFSFAALVTFVLWIGVAKIAEVDDLNGVLQRLYIGVWFMWTEIMAFKLNSVLRQPSRREQAWTTA